MSVKRCLTLALLAAPFGPWAIARAQDLPPCDYVLENTGTTRLNFSRTPSGQSVTFLGQGVVVTCAGQANRLTSDSAEFYEDRGQLLFIGNVKYTEPRAAIDAARMTYFLDEARVSAEGSVVARLENGSVMRGPSADYYRSVVGRPVSRLIAVGRPQLSLVQLDSLGRAAEPVVVLADQLVIEGDSLVYASRRVDISRSAIQANSDSAFVDGEREYIQLMKSPVVVGRGARSFTLRGGTIDLFSKNRQLERVLATPAGHVISSDIELLADSIDLRLSGERLQRAFAWGPGRARATSPDRDITADSLDIVLPNQRLQTVTAIGDAYANSVPDTARIVSNERDWMRGDTIIARFDSATASDTAARAQPRELIASGSARSFYHLGNPEGIRDRPTLNYVRGRLISVAFADGEVSTVTVIDKASGIYLEAEAGSPAPVNSSQPRPPPPPPPPPPPSPPPAPPRSGAG